MKLIQNKFGAAINQNILCRLSLNFLFVVLLSMGLLNAAFGYDTKHHDNMNKPSVRGAYNVGFQTIPQVELRPGFKSDLTIWYPTKIPGNSVYMGLFQSGAASAAFTLDSPLHAKENAPVFPKKTFPMVIYDHGGGSSTNIGRLVNMAVLEHWASHGFIVVSYNHELAPPPPFRFGENMQGIINFMTGIDKNGQPVANAAPSALSSAINGRTALVGLSTGGAAPLDFADDAAPDPRVVALLPIEPNLFGPPNTTINLVAIKLPFLTIDGSHSPSIGFRGRVLFENAINAYPRYIVTLNGPVHVGFESSICDIIEANRNISLNMDPGVEPLTCLACPNTNAALAASLWNVGQFLNLTVGNNRESCNYVGVNNPIIDLDTNPKDGITDTVEQDGLYDPTLLLQGLTDVPPRLTNKQQIKLYKLYSTAFLKVYVDQDPKYKKYLVPGYSNHKASDAALSVCELKNNHEVCHTQFYTPIP